MKDSNVLGGKIRNWLAALTLAALALGLSFHLYLKQTDAKRTRDMAASLTIKAPPDPPFVEVPIPQDLLDALENPQAFQLKHRTADLPASVKAAFAKAAKEPKFAMAEPNAWPWSVGDARIGGLPSRRLRAIAIREPLCIIFYEHGGYAKSDEVAVIRLNGNEAQAIWHGSVGPDVTTPAQLRDLLRGQAYGNDIY